MVFTIGENILFGAVIIYMSSIIGLYLYCMFYSFNKISIAENAENTKNDKCNKYNIIELIEQIKDYKYVIVSNNTENTINYIMSKYMRNEVCEYLKNLNDNILEYSKCIEKIIPHDELCKDMYIIQMHNEKINNLINKIDNILDFVSDISPVFDDIIYDISDNLKFISSKNISIMDEFNEIILLHKIEERYDNMVNTLTYFENEFQNNKSNNIFISNKINSMKKIIDKIDILMNDIDNLDNKAKKSLYDNLAFYDEKFNIQSAFFIDSLIYKTNTLIK